MNQVPQIKPVTTTPEKTDQNPQQPPSIPEPTGASGPLGDLDDLEIPFFEAEAGPEFGPEPGGVSTPGLAPGILTKDQFFGMFRALIAAPNGVLAFQKKPQLTTLVIAENDQAARAASDALWDTCNEVPWLRWMIEPGSVWAQRAFVIGGFVVPLSIAARAEYVALNAKPVNPEPKKTEGGAAPVDESFAPNPPEFSG
ncbi:MAG: hypothetical protein P1U69_03235 [Parvibaculaceae bacterium]|nr:hypothetical protein [Parvibaculaceae bacterium]